MASTTAVQTKSITQVTGLARVTLAVALGLLSAVMLIFAFQPYHIWPLAFISIVPMVIAAHRVMPRRWAGLPMAIGMGVWLAVLLTAIFGFSLNAWFFLAIALLVALINLIGEPGTRLFHERTNYRWFVLQGAVNLVGIEMIRSFIPAISTHVFMVQTVAKVPWLIQPISIFSMYGMSLVIMLVNYALAGAALAWIDHKWQSLSAMTYPFRLSTRWLVVVGVVLTVWCAIGIITLAAAPAGASTLRVAAIQPGYIKPGHQDPENQEARLQVLAEQTRAAAAQGAKLMVWPELALGFDPQVEHTAELRALAAETDAYLLIGYGVADDPRGWRNEAVMLAPDGAFLPVYGKNFGSVGEGQIATAGVYPVYDTPLGRIGTIICNDVNFTAPVRTLANNGAQLVTIPTLEGAMPGFHWEMPIQGVLRGVENRVATIKADTAYSALIADPYGRILASRDGAPDGEAFALVADVPLGTGSTIYNRLGDWVGWLSLAGLMFFTVLQIVKNRGTRKQ